MPHSTNDSTSSQTRMSVPSSTSTYSTNVFPKQAGAALQVPDANAEPNSPSSTSQFSFASSPHSVQGIEQIAFSQNRPETRGTTRRAQYYEDQFTYKDGIASSARERVTKDAPIIADLKTNVIIKDEYTLVTDLSHHLSTRFQRPETSIMISVNHSACLLLGGTFEPTYILTINALPVQLQTTTNKRNASLIQNFMCESIGVPAERGVLKFVSIQEDSLATNGTTILGEIERLERQQAEENGGGLKRALTKSSRKPSVSKAKSSNLLSTKLSFRANTGRSANVTSSLPNSGQLDSGIVTNEKGGTSPAPLQPDSSKINHKKSEPIFSKPENFPGPPPIPETKLASSRMKSKSLLNIFRR